MQLLPFFHSLFSSIFFPMKGLQSYISLMLDNYLTSSRWFTKNLGKFIYKEFMSTHIPTVNALFTPSHRLLRKVKHT